MKEKEIEIKLRIWIYSNGEKLVGKGRIELLELIKETGSISSAAKKMKMSYRQAWQMVKEMNECASSPLVKKQLGGKQGGGAYLTDLGEKTIHEFKELEQKLTEFAENEISNLTI